MNSRFRLILLLALLVTMSLACRLTQANEETQVTPTSRSAPPTSTPKTESPTFEATPTNEPQRTVSPTTYGPEEVEAAYFEALKQQDFEQVAALISDYSLSLSGTSRQGIVSLFEKKDFEGWRMVDYRVIESRMLDDQSALVYVMTKEQSGENEPQSYDFWVAVRKEDEQWYVNWNLLVDDLLLDIEPQTINNLSIQPVRIIRYTDKMRLNIRIENTNSRGCFWGWVGDEIATFHFDDQVVDVSGSLEIEPERTYPDAYVDIDGFFEVYPVAFDLSEWQWASQTSPNLPDLESDSWAYHFDLKGSTP